MKRFSIYLIVAIIGLLITSFLFQERYVFGFPRPIVGETMCPPASGPSGSITLNLVPCEDLIHEINLLYDLIFWLIITYSLVVIFRVLKINVKLNFKFNKVSRKISLKGIGVIIGIVVVLLILLSMLSQYSRQDAYCGGFTGRAVCPFGYYCPRGGYPDELKQCVSWFKFFKPR